MIRHIVASGCSFTADGVGGIPPNQDHPDGACSFTAYAGIESAEPQSWIGLVAQALQATSLVNVAASGHGNVMVAMNLINVLSRFKYDASDTLILFNITDPARLDLVCDWNHAQASKHVTWPSAVLPYSFFDPGSDFLRSVRHEMGPEHIEMHSSSCLQGLLGWLSSRGYQFAFLTMRDYTDCEPLWSVIQCWQDQHIKLMESKGMMEFVQHHGQVRSQQDPHPTLQGHRLIAQQVLHRLGYIQQG